MWTAPLKLNLSVLRVPSHHVLRVDFCAMGRGIICATTAMATWSYDWELIEFLRTGLVFYFLFFLFASYMIENQKETLQGYLIGNPNFLFFIFLLLEHFDL